MVSYWCRGLDLGSNWGFWRPVLLVFTEKTLSSGFQTVLLIIVSLYLRGTKVHLFSGSRSGFLARFRFPRQNET